MEKITTILISCLFCCSLSAQTAYSTLGSLHQVRINSNGSIGIDLQTLTPASFYNGENNYPILSQAGLWLVALDENDQYHTAVNYLSAKDSFDFWPGPIDTLTGQTGEISLWDKTWKVTAQEIENHRNNFKSAGYTIASEIANWPAQGEGGFANYLAPFVDVNFNKVYDPINGDYPAIKGEETVYCIFNDLEDEHTASLGQEIGIEVQLMAYKNAASSALYLEYFIINRRPTNFKNIEVGFFISGGCGNPQDNFAGTLQNYPQSIFIYNGLDNDLGYFGNNTPYVVATFFNENLQKSIAFTDSNLKNGAPKINADYILLGQNKWKDNTPLTYGGDGTTTGTISDYIFGHSDPTPGTFWSEDKESNTPGKRTIIGKHSKTNFKQKDFIKLDIAIDMGILQNRSNYLDSIFLKSARNLSYYNRTTHVPLSRENSSVEVYPNPTKGPFTVQSQEPILEILLTDIQGNIVYREQNIKKARWQSNVSIPPGIYTVQLITNSNLYNKKLCITP